MAADTATGITGESKMMTYNELAEMTVCPLHGCRVQGLRSNIEAIQDRFATLVCSGGHTKTLASEEGCNLLALSVCLQADWLDWYGEEFPHTRWTGSDEFGTPNDS